MPIPSCFPDPHPKKEVGKSKRVGQAWQIDSKVHLKEQTS